MAEYGLSRQDRTFKSQTQQCLLKVDDPYVNYGNLPYIAQQAVSSTALDSDKAARHPRKRSQVLSNTRTPVLRQLSEPQKEYGDSRFLEKRRLTDVESVVKKYILRKHGSERLRPKQAYELVVSELPTVVNQQLM